jgi:RNA polymerase sigma-70 factor (ECF subfamily)
VLSLVTDPLPAAARPPPPAAPCLHESDTIRAAAAGDARAFEQLVRTHSRRVHGFLVQFTRNTHDADDLTQQTFIKAYRHLGSFDCSRPLVNWLLTIARRTALNHFRSARRWEPADETLPAPEPSPAHALEQSERSANLWTRARRLLSDREYEILWLRFAEDLSVAETARIVGLTRIHVKVIAHRARTRLAQGVPPA